MALTIAAITIIFILCLLVAIRVAKNRPVFTDEQLLNQHRRFLEDLESSRKYIGASYLNAREAGSAAERELTGLGYDVARLLAERFAAERDERPMDWQACRRPGGARPQDPVR
ncbi:MAG: hypothetical protein O3B08_05320 [Proteobacteria bacterium]|nr:hypothetical protein [Pseudomonadota bacterium]